MLGIMRFTSAILAVVLSYIWFAESRVPSSYVAIPASVLMLLAAWHAMRTREWGLTLAAMRPGLGAAVAVTLPAIAVLLAVGAALGTLHDRRDFVGTLMRLVAWGGAQQWVLQTVVLREAQATTSRRAGLLVAPLLFAAVHLPNPFLAAMTLVGALGWCAIYDRYPNVVPLALSHAILTLAILYAFDDALTGRLRVGYGYLLLHR